MKKRLLFKDETAELIQKNAVDKTTNLMNELVLHYNTIAKQHGLSPLHSEDLNSLINDPKELVSTKFKQTIEIPKGMNPEKYLNLLEAPQIDFTTLIEIGNSLPIRHAALFQIENDKLVLNKAVYEDLINSHHYFVNDDSNKAKAYEALKTLAEAVNNLASVSSGAMIFNHSQGLNLDNLLTRSIEGERVVYGVNRDKAIRLLTQVLES